MTEASDYLLANCKYAYKCTKTWEDLEITSSQEVRYCSDCQEEVYYCRTKLEIVSAIKKRKCIAIYLDDNYASLMPIGQIIEK
jgi:hypothetical protein